MVPSKRLAWSAVVAALGGFLFGFDTVVISGAEQTIQSLWSMSDVMHGLATSAALWGTVLGALTGSLPTDRIGRKATLCSIGVLYLVSAVWSGLATGPYSFMIARFIGGVGVGISTVAAPLYIAEIAPPAWRGRLTGMFQFNIVFGILIAFLSNYLLGSNLSENAWRWMLGIEALPALIYTLLTFGIPESPRWLISFRGNTDGARRVLSEIHPQSGTEEIEAAIAEISSAARAEESGAQKAPGWLLTPMLLAFAIAFFNQLSGINAILYFAPRILGMTGLGEQAAMIQSTGIGLVNLLFTLVGLWLIDHLGRKRLILIGSVGYIASLSLISAVFFANAASFEVAAVALESKPAFERLVDDLADEPDVLDDATAARTKLADATGNPRYAPGPAGLPGVDNPIGLAASAERLAEQASAAAGSGGRLVLLGIFAFIASHAVGQGAVIWVFISEIFPNEHRAIGNSVGSGTHWVFAALVTMAFPVAAAAFAPGYIFAFFAVMMVLQIVWAMTLMPETKGVPLEEIQQQFASRRG
ncbi:putative metabolite transport protein CsbC [Posidoniimonas polymericola]|uniref:Putative metabolite transport protein CsbC n=1 Tax=Posidoniimonas polymericola TaxID=2528002 RepID=A0A5C5XVD5_9BACT|nr:sugar porter family MFS transporter [Posidoniimonas polymericola]TWT66850.1 putative metabolite transport protein CsbC [Posidoniimonas polymericola]